MSKFLQSRGAVADEVVAAVGVPVVDLNPEIRKEEIKDDNNDDGADEVMMMLMVGKTPMGFWPLFGTKTCFSVFS